jgi:APA family basic amino acid/polyamine antiporter
MNYTGGVVAAYRALFLMGTITAVVVYAASAMADLTLQIRDQRSGVTLRWQSVLTAVVALLVSIFAIVGSGVEVASYTLLLLVAGLPIYYWLKYAAEKTA